MGKPEGFSHEKGWYRDDSSLLRSAQRGLFFPYGKVRLLTDLESVRNC